MVTAIETSFAEVERGLLEEYARARADVERQIADQRERLIAAAPETREAMVELELERRLRTVETSEVARAEVMSLLD